MDSFILKTAIALLSNRPKPIYVHLKRHFGRDPRKNVIVKLEFPTYRLGCVARALLRCMATGHRRGKMLGLATSLSTPEFIELIHPDSFAEQLSGPVQYVDVELSDGKSMSCPEKSIYLLCDGQHRVAVWLARQGYDEKLVLEIMARDRHVAHNFISRLRGLVNERSIFKGKAITMRQASHRETKVEFHHVPKVTTEQLILPADVVDQISRHTLLFGKHKELLLKHGRHLKRGLLLYGPPGTGKSLTIAYLLSEMPERTTMLLTGQGVAHLEDACAMARALQPATVVIDDVDLIAEERSRFGSSSILFDLLNQMDGIGDDADVLFLLTTNRPEILEPALAARPGRVDQSIFVPLPDYECRKRLFELYGKGLTLELKDLESFIQRTDGASAAFIRELFRAAAIFAAEDGLQSNVSDKHFESAMDLLLGKDSLTGKLLGFVGREEQAATSEIRDS